MTLVWCFCNRIFSEGGNFCPEEVEEFRKKLVRQPIKDLDIFNFVFSMILKLSTLVYIT